MRGLIGVVLGILCGCAPGTDPPEGPGEMVVEVETVCGDAVCEGEETCDTCAEDCACDAALPAMPAACGDGFCAADETFESCPDDCPAPIMSCGNGNCETFNGENCDTCAQDCGACPPSAGAMCGDGMCDAGEACDTCAQDCGACPPAGPMCGDGMCDAGETCDTCAQDCGACPPAEPMCGDGMCNGAETCGDCAQDCGACPPMCGDGQCDAGESCGDCAEDCGACPPICGNDVCEMGENCGECAQDCGACDWPPELVASEAEILRLVNELRATGVVCGVTQMQPVGPLIMEPLLSLAARLHSQDMGDNNYFSHQGLDGSSFGDRAFAAGYRGMAAGENIAAGSFDAAGTFQQWVNSPGHCSNMMTARFTKIGVGHAVSPGSDYGHYWTQIFAL